MTYVVYEDGPFESVDPPGEFMAKRWALRCNGERVLGDWFPSECHVVSDGEWERTRVADLRESAYKDGWRTYHATTGQIADLCPPCRERAKSRGLIRRDVE